MTRVFTALASLVGLGLLLIACQPGADSSEPSALAKTYYCPADCGHQGNKSTICHIPPGNPKNAHTLCVGRVAAGHHIEQHGDYCGPCGPQEPVCGDQQCEAAEENCASCPQDCGQCEPVCGDEVCLEPGESCDNCPADCGACEECEDCSPVCGDNQCNGEETCLNCEQDCGPCPVRCGDGECSVSESCRDCPSDCGECVDPKVETTVTGGQGCSTAKGATMLSIFAVLLLLGAARRRRLLLALASLPLLFSAGTVSAQVSGDPAVFRLERFEMPLDEGGIINVEGAAVADKNSWGLNLWLGYADDPLVVQRRQEGQDFERVGSLVGQQTSGSIGGYKVLHEGLSFGARLAFSLDQGRDSGELTGLDSLRGTGLSELTLMGKHNLLSQKEDNFDLALGLNLSVPLVYPPEYTGEGFPTFSPYVATGRFYHTSYGYWRTSANLGVKLRESKQVADLEISEEAFARLGMAYGHGDGELGVSLAYSGGLANLGANNSNYLELMGGYTHRFSPSWAVLAGGGTGLNSGYGAPDWRAFVGVRYTAKASPKKAAATPPLPEPVPETEPETEPEPEPVPSKQLVVVIADTYFAFDKSEVKPEYRKLLLKSGREIADLLRQQPQLRVALEGHTDSIGGKKYNVRLSLRRAEAVTAILVEAGVPKGRIETMGTGELYPVADNTTVEGRARNRRVEVYVLGANGKLEVEEVGNLPDKSTYDGFGRLRERKAH